MPSVAKTMKDKGSAWNKARTAPPRGREPVPDGSYPAVVSAECETLEDGAERFRLVATISEGEHEGRTIPRSYFCRGDEPADLGAGDMPTAEQQLAGDLKTLLPDVDIDNIEWEQVTSDLVAEINDRQIECRIALRTRETRSGPNKGRKYQNLYFNKLLSDVPEDEDGAAAASQPEAGGAQEAELEDTGEDVAPSKGDTVLYTPAGQKTAKEYEVTAVNQSRRTVDIKNQGGRAHKEVSWDAIQILVEEG